MFVQPKVLMDEIKGSNSTQQLSEEDMINVRLWLQAEVRAVTLQVDIK